MALKFSNTEVTEVIFNNTNCEKVYFGSTLVFEKSVPLKSITLDFKNKQQKVTVVYEKGSYVHTVVRGTYYYKKGLCFKMTPSYTWDITVTFTKAVTKDTTITLYFKLGAEGKFTVNKDRYIEESDCTVNSSTTHIKSVTISKGQSSIKASLTINDSTFESSKVWLNDIQYIYAGTSVKSSLNKISLALSSITYDNKTTTISGLSTSTTFTNPTANGTKTVTGTETLTKNI